MSDPPPSDAGPLLGRHLEQRLISSLLADIGERGGALVLRGDPGIGKSRLLAEAAAGARDGGIATLSTAGIQSESHLAFAGLHLLLRPVRAHAAKLPPVLATALDTAFGLTTTPSRPRSASRWRCSTSSPRPRPTGRCCSSSRTPTGSIAQPRTCWHSSHDAWTPTRSSSSPPPARATTRRCSPRGFPSTGSMASTTMRPSRCSTPRPAGCPRRFAPASCASPPATRWHSGSYRSRRARRPTTPRPGTCP